VGLALHRPGNCLEVAYASVKLYAKNIFLAISRTVLAFPLKIHTIIELES
jgi:hypothetical protein